MVESLISKFDIQKLKESYKNSKPFNHVTLDNFWNKEVSKNLEKEIKNFNKDKKYSVTEYDNAIEKKNNM